MTFPNAQNLAAGAIPVWITAGQSGTTGPTNAQAGKSVSGNVGATSAGLIVAGSFAGWLTIQNTHATQTLYVSFNAPATASDFAIASGAALTLPFGPTNTLNGIGSGAATTFAVVGY